MQLMTISRLGSFRTCRRLHYYQYELGAKPLRKAQILGFGTMLHNALEQWWLAWGDVQEGSHVDPLVLAFAGIEATWAGVSEETELNEFDLVKVEELVRGYHFRWAPEMGDLEVLAVEAQFGGDDAVCRLVNPLTGRLSQTFSLGGKIDVLLRRRSTGTKHLMEHKSTTADLSPGADYWARLRMDGQISTYFDGAVTLGHPVESCIYDVAKRPTLKPLKETPEDKREYTKPRDAKPGKPCKVCKETSLARAKEYGEKLLVKEIPYDPGCSDCTPPKPAEPSRLYSGMRDRNETPEEYRVRLRTDIVDNPNAYYQRGDVVRLEQDMDEHRTDVWMSCQSLRDNQLAARELGAKAWPRNPGACVRFGRFCEYYDVCTGAASIDDPARFRQARSVHEELDIEQRPEEVAQRA